MLLLSFGFLIFEYLIRLLDEQSGCREVQLAWVAQVICSRLEMSKHVVQVATGVHTCYCWVLILLDEILVESVIVKGLDYLCKD